MISGTSCNDQAFVNGVEIKPDPRQQLEHSLATTFVTMQRERVPEKRQGLWLECQRLAKELEKLSDEPNKM